MKDVILALIPPLQPTLIPLGLGYLSASLKNHGIKTEVVDFRVHSPEGLTMPTEYHLLCREGIVCQHVPDLDVILGIVSSGRYPALLERGLRARELRTGDLMFRKHLIHLERLCEKWIRLLQTSKVVGFSLHSSNFLSTIFVATRLRQSCPDVFITFGGPHLSSELVWEFVAKLGVADALVIGEGEKTIVDLIQKIPSSKHKLQVPGTIICLKDGAFKVNPPTPPANLDLLPIPDFSSLDLKAYKKQLWFPFASVDIPIQASRGCPYSCKFCSERRIYSPFRQRNASLVAEEMVFQSKKYGYRTFYFCDSLLNASEEWLKNFCHTLIEHDRKFYWWCFLRANISRKLARLLRTAGCISTTVGAESFHDPTLRRMNKRRCSEENLSSIQNLIGNNIFVTMKWIIGYPDEDFNGQLKTQDTILRKILKLKRKDLIKISCSLFHILPCSGFDVRNEYKKLKVRFWRIDLPEELGYLSDTMEKIPAFARQKELGELIYRYMTARNIVPYEGDSLPVSQVIGSDYIESLDLEIFYPKLREDSIIKGRNIQIQKDKKCFFEQVVGQNVIVFDEWEEKLIDQLMKSDMKLSRLAEILPNVHKRTHQESEKALKSFLNNMLAAGVLTLKE